MSTVPHPPNFREAELEMLLADAFRRAGWKMTIRQLVHDQIADLAVANRKHRYAVEFKAASEGRGDRLIPLLAQAILEVRAKTCLLDKAVKPLAVVGAPRISISVEEEAKSFAGLYAPEIAIGLIDLEGFRFFKGPGLESLNAPRAFLSRRLVPIQGAPAHLFSDLNQWMLKILLAPRIPGKLLTAPRGEYKNASQLAESAGVSVMSAFRFVHRLEEEGFLDDSGGVLKVVRVPELMRRWQAAGLRPVRELPMSFVIRGDDDRVYRSLPSYASKSRRAAQDRSQSPARPWPRACLGLFAAADALGTGFVHGVAPHLYLERPDDEVIRQLGLQSSENNMPVDIYVRIPGERESVFRPAVERKGLPVCDILQVWLDVSLHTARGSAQAEEIRRRLLSPLFEAGA